MRLVITGTDQDSKNAQHIMTVARQAKPINACGKTTINQLVCLIRKCSVYISSDSAPLHIAASCQIPFVALFGPTDPRRHLPLAQDYVLLQKCLPCAPCYRRRCRNNRCMDSIRPEEVLEAITKLLK